MNGYLRKLLLLGLLFSGTTCTIMAQNRPIIYQLLPRLFGNKQTNNVPYGTIEQNGSGKFDDINEKALQSIRELGITHVWYTGVIAHASLTDYSAYGIPKDDADVVKGRAGSPYAIRDYYDVDPDLATDVNQRMQEFEKLISRTHQQGMKVLIDFVPNHVARHYQSQARPDGVQDFGATDDNSKSFSPANDYYYVPGKPFLTPVTQGPENPLTALQDNYFDEVPAKATGNNVFSQQPKIDDWYETVKLNYGVDYVDGESKHFDPIPGLWHKMAAILNYWADKNIDGFRCDMVEMVPVEFWQWVIPEVRKNHPDLIFIGEAYNPTVYKDYLLTGHFDYLYDKVGLYDGLKKLIRNQEDADVKAISKVWQEESKDFGNRMLRFLENHDEERIASSGFAGNAQYALPAMVISATLSGGPVMVYFGQEVGEPAKWQEGFGGDDNRTTIFDYWGVPEHQKWMNNGAFDGALLTEEQRLLRGYYKKLMEVCGQDDVIINGEILEIPLHEQRAYAFVRYTASRRLLVVANFGRAQALQKSVVIPDALRDIKEIQNPTDLLTGTIVEYHDQELMLNVPPMTAQIIEF